MPRSKSTRSGPVRVGCAGWSILKEHAGHFAVEGTHLSRYASRFSMVEINSSFYRPHRPATYAKWAASVPEDFRFAVKVPREITHERRLTDVNDPLDRFLSEATALGEKLGPLLVQLPPSLAFSADVVKTFFASLRERFDGDAVLEPRHKSWFETPVERLLARFRVARVAADPAVVEAASEPGGWDGLAYYRLHGSPRTYYSTYSPEYLELLSDKLSAAARSKPIWCVFDNTAEGAATANALDVEERIRNA